MVEAIVLDQKRILPCAAWLEGEYGMKGLFLGVPCKLGRGGMEKIIEVTLTRDEKAALAKSAEAVREPMGVDQARRAASGSWTRSRSGDSTVGKKIVMARDGAHHRRASCSCTWPATCSSSRARSASTRTRTCCMTRSTSSLWLCASCCSWRSCCTSWPRTSSHARPRGAARWIRAARAAGRRPSRRARCAGAACCLLLFIVYPHPALHDRHAAPGPFVARRRVRQRRDRLPASGGCRSSTCVAMCVRTAPVSRRVGAFRTLGVAPSAQPTAAAPALADRWSRVILWAWVLRLVPMAVSRSAGRVSQ